MASTGIDQSGGKWPANETATAYGAKSEATNPMPYSSNDSLKPVYDYTHRKLKPRHIQLIGIGGCDECPGLDLRSRLTVPLGL